MLNWPGTGLVSAPAKDTGGGRWDLVHGTSLSPFPSSSPNLKISDAIVFVPFSHHTPVILLLTTDDKQFANKHQQTVSAVVNKHIDGIVA